MKTQKPLAEIQPSKTEEKLTLSDFLRDMGATIEASKASAKKMTEAQRLEQGRRNSSLAATLRK